MPFVIRMLRLSYELHVHLFVWLYLILLYKNLAVYNAFQGRHPQTRRSKAANITKDDITYAAHRQNVTVLWCVNNKQPVSCDGQLAARLYHFLCCKVGQTDLVSGLWSEFMSRSVHYTSLQVSLHTNTNTEIIAEYQHYFGFSLPSKLIERKRNKFVNNYENVSLL